MTAAARNALKWKIITAVSTGTAVIAFVGMVILCRMIAVIPAVFTFFLTVGTLTFASAGYNRYRRDRMCAALCREVEAGARNIADVAEGAGLSPEGAQEIFILSVASGYIPGYELSDGGEIVSADQ